MKISSAGNVGIGTTAPTQMLEVNGGTMLNTATTEPTYSSSNRGTIWFKKGGTGVADALDACIKDALENYVWVKLN